MRRKRGADYKLTRSFAVGWAVVLLHHLVVIGTGLAGFLGESSQSAERILGGQVGIWMWSGGFVLFGGLAVIARIFRRILTEIVAVCAIAAFRLLWAVMILISYEQVAQYALSMMAGAVFLIGWAASALAYLRTGGAGIVLRAPIEELRDQLAAALKSDER